MEILAAERSMARSPRSRELVSRCSSRTITEAGQSQWKQAKVNAILPDRFHRKMRCDAYVTGDDEVADLAEAPLERSDS
jgi:hypothetical protein